MVGRTNLSPFLFFCVLLNYCFPAEWVITATSYAVDTLQEDDLPKDFLNQPDIHEQITEAASQPGFAARVATLIANYCVDAYERKRSSEQANVSQDSDSSSSNGQVVREELSTRSIRQLFSDIVNKNVSATYPDTIFNRKMILLIYA